ncbi:MAG: methyltransferase domain-containing protein [Actinobacteria bacterium]|nr:methyltransferase domain-containing protein [Actinomycetota bacterium]
MEPDRFAGKAEWFDDHYETTRGRVRLQLVLERLVARLPPPPAKVLDAGGGTGANSIPLAKLGYAVTVLDASLEWLDVARRRASEAEVGVQIVPGMLEEADRILTSGFDAVLCHAVLMYSDDPTSGPTEPERANRVTEGRSLIRACVVSANVPFDGQRHRRAE